MDVETNLKVKTENPNEEVCELDLLHYIGFYEKYTLKTCLNEIGESCFSIKYDLDWRDNLIDSDPIRNKDLNRQTSEYLDRPKRIVVCDNTITYTTQSGETNSYSVDSSTSFLSGMDLGIYQNPVSIDSLESLIFSNNPGEVQVLENYYLISNLNIDGNVVNTYIDKLSGMIRYTETIGPDGELLDKTIHEYVCVGGKLFPKLLIDIVKEITPHCNTEIWAMQTTLFTNHQIN